jgi:uncharacterized protein (DUF2225 family)
MRGFLPGDAQQGSGAAGATVPNEEIEALFDREFHCPVCDTVFKNKIIRSGKNRLNGQDIDLRGHFEPVDAEKYNVLMCPECGHAAMSRYFNVSPGKKAEAIREWMKPEPEPEDPSFYTYEMAINRIRAAMKDAMIRSAKTSETGYIALHSAWLLRGYREQMEKDATDEHPVDETKCKRLKDAEEMYIAMATERLTQAVTAESFPICGMEEQTFQYLLAALHYKTGKYAEAMRFLLPVLQDRKIQPNLRIMAEDLRDECRKKQRAK